MHCKFVAESIDYQGQAIRATRLELAEHTTNAVTELEHRTKQTKLR